MTIDGGELRIECSSALTPEVVARIDGLAHEATHVDGVPPLSDHALMHTRYGGSATLHILGWSGLDLVAYAHLDTSDVTAGPQAELVVHPRYRRRGHGQLLVRTMRDLAPDGRMQLWAHGQLPGSQLLADRMGFRRTRGLVQMRRPLDTTVGPAALPDGLTVRAFVPGTDEEPLLSLNNAAFADHPDQGGWTARELEAREREPWFDPAGLLLLARANEGLDGFVWTKVHGAASGSSNDDHHHAPIGEIYVLGVAPHAQRRGLGRTLALLGLAHLAARGLPEAMLYVDEDNVAAVALYDGLGFHRVGVDVLFAVPK